ncbi:hypothetical protein AKO1_008179 [Acrasis kona]
MEINTCVGPVPPTWVAWAVATTVFCFQDPLQVSLRLMKATCVDSFGAAYTIYIERYGSTYVVRSIVQNTVTFSYTAPIETLIWIEGRQPTSVIIIPRIVTKVTAFSVAKCVKNVLSSDKWKTPGVALIAPASQYGGPVFFREFYCGRSTYSFFVELGLGKTFLLDLRRRKSSPSRRVFHVDTKLVKI